LQDVTDMARHAFDQREADRRHIDRAAERLWEQYAGCHDEISQLIMARITFLAASKHSSDAPFPQPRGFKLMKIARKLARDCGEFELERQCSWRLAEFYRRQGDYAFDQGYSDEGIRLHKQARRILWDVAEAECSVVLVVATHWELGKTYYKVPSAMNGELFQAVLDYAETRASAIPPSVEGIWPPFLPNLVKAQCYDVRARGQLAFKASPNDVLKSIGQARQFKTGLSFGIANIALQYSEARVLLNSGSETDRQHALAKLWAAYDLAVEERIDSQAYTGRWIFKALKGQTGVDPAVVHNTHTPQ
jgi:hypothetical protein